MSESRRVLLTISLLTFTVSILQIVMSRVFAGLIYDSLNYFPISLALLGLSGGGVRLFVLEGRLPGSAEEIAQRYIVRALIAVFGFLAAVLVTSALSGGLIAETLVDMPADAREAFFFRSRIPLMALYGGAAVFPFYFLGVAIAVLLRGYARMVNAVYFFDLMGATVGAALAVPLLNWATSVNYFLAAALALVVACSLTDRRWLVPLGVLVASIAWVQLNDSPRLEAPTLRVVKHGITGEISATRWSSAAYLQMWSPTRGPWRVLQDHQSTVVGGDFSAAERRCQDTGQCEVADWLILTRALDRVPRSVCILTAGVGLQAREAWDVGIRDVTAVEMNPSLLSFSLATHPGDPLGPFLRDSGVNYVIDEARHFIRATEREYDLVYIPPAGFAKVAALPTTPNHLFTEEAIVEYLERLTPNGMIAIQVNQPWMPDAEDLRARFASVLRGGMERAGIERPEEHVLAVVPTGFLFVSKAPFSPEAIAGLEAALVAGGGARVQSLSELEQGLDVSRWQVTDDYPFAFGASNWSKVVANLMWWVRPDAPASAETVSSATLLISLVLVPLVILLPLMRAGGVAFRPGDWPAVAYFFCLGAGFMLIEIPLMEKLIFALGHPTHSISFCLALLFATTGIGSYVSGHVLWGPDGLNHRRLNAAVVAIVALQIGLYFGAQPLLTAALSLPTAVQYLVIAAGIAPLGMLLGTPFPQGISLLRDGGKEQLIPWAWGVNGAASVLAVNAAVVTMRIIGVAPVFLAAAALYFAALVLLNVSLLPASRASR